MSHRYLGSPANKRCAILKAGMFAVVTIEAIIFYFEILLLFFWFPNFSFCFFFSFGFCNDTIVQPNLLEATTQTVKPSWLVVYENLDHIGTNFRLISM